MTIRKAIFAFVRRTLGARHAGQLLLYSAGTVALLLLLSSWICGVQRAEAEQYHPLFGNPEVWETLALADIFALMLLGIGLLVVIPASIVSSVAGEQRSGTLEQLRTTPIRPLGLLLGLVLGAPVRLYLLCAGPLLLHLLAGLLSGTPFHAVLMPVLVLGVGGLAFGLLGAAVGLTQRGGRGAMVTLGLAGISGITALWAAVMAQTSHLAKWAFLHPWGAVHAQLLSHSELYRRLTMGYRSSYSFNNPEFVDALELVPLLAVALFSAVAVILIRASCRRLAKPQVPLLSKAQALALFALAAAAIMLPNLADLPTRWDAAAACALVCQLVLLPWMVVLTAFASPGHDLWLISLRRVRRSGYFSDDAPPFVLSLAMIGVFMLLAVSCFVDASGPFNRFYERMLGAGLMALVLMATVPVYVHFGATRFVSHRARTAYVFGIIAHLGVQVAAIVMIAAGAVFDGGDDRFEMLFLKLALALGVMVPAWIIWRQRVLRARMLTPSC